MDDDVKNLFQKFGQSTEGYQEINRDAESEQARQRWPLLRDVRVHAPAGPVLVEQYEDAPKQVFPLRAEAEDHSSTRQGAGREMKSSLFVANQQSNGAMSQAEKKISQNVVESSLFIHRAVPAAHEESVVPIAPPSIPVKSIFAKAQSAAVSRQALMSPAHDISEVNNSGTPTPGAFSSNHSLGDVFNRLAGKQEPVKPVESTVNSFFKKIFKP
ncbi:MAG: hypothetical protein KGM99_18895 [Burkholderiales bacterium]|nr:hypothetical protein [Burkholderiales bacterium]